MIERVGVVDVVADGPQVRAAARVRAAAEAAGPVRLLRTLYLPGDEVCFYVFESDRPGLAGDSGLWGSLGFDRVQPVVAIEEA